ncbi:tryptophan 7-halogenase [Aestuariibacter halophilus]|uniref:Tryptophan 7-halogenase n=1 Tax=Fluctibacter halophilus TaxID=226011 RepID=A0ABS8G4N9_9ALTE|nr:tryptophan halogenase family protein [Aestuariibacter halophilus]MCC2615493.1 tryptophan 7-halogenase [Aestuariibacter halophilus]
MNQQVQRLVVVGGGSSGWMAASLLKRLFGQQLDVTLVESDDIATVGVGEATIPPILFFNRALGIDENAFLKATGGTFKLGIEFDGWFEPQQAYMHAFGRLGKDMGLAGFHHTWLKARANGDARSFWDFSVNYQAAKQARYQPLSMLPNTNLPGLVHAYHFDAGLYAKYLRSLCEQWGVKRVEGRIEHVSLAPQSGFIESVDLADGQRIQGDFFIDCSGFRALLISEALKTGYEDWRHWLPCDRAVAVGCEATEPRLPYTRSIAHEFGWQWRIPLQHRTGNGLVYSSEHCSEDDAAATLLANLDGKALGEPRTIRFTTGRRQKQWYKNCLALGLSSGFLEPLESTSLHMVQSGLVRFIKLFPKHGINPETVDEYNRQSKVEFERIRDFIILHYHLNARSEPFWQRCRNMPIPPELERRIALFRQSGSVFREQDELFTEVAWQQVMLGQGNIPEHYHPLADSLSDTQVNELLNNLQTLINGTVEGLQTHDSYLQQHCHR